jgi:RNA-directed DNA polymerase
MSGQEGKSFAIPKELVWRAWKQVKANGGAAGADGVTTEMFEKDLKDNLYKVWNRMSSGTYFPPPVRAVEIPKSSGGTRMLGVPTDDSYCPSCKCVPGCFWIGAELCWSGPRPRGR